MSRRADRQEFGNALYDGNDEQMKECHDSSGDDCDGTIVGLYMSGFQNPSTI
jgi:hypothetical protein